ncbi:pilus assembly protein [Burkholderia ubonensis]|uniref:pilus assembly protein n=1 Tax=Burkholderia ubonensis TaxID=101571 RepID=UPI0009B4B757|nr:pilus assembly protein [Burkholderia ubonensis]
MLRFIKLIKSLSRYEHEVSALEYAVLAGIVAVAVAAAGTILGGDSGLPGLFQNLITKVISVQNNGH